ncbi:MAG: HEAT repeat domain-containing protein [Deltaproteobacteria bacterium]|nr:HEAT repeat domain-containing protein [Deltaproteobacteria bacterium]
MCVFILGSNLYQAQAKEPTQTENTPASQSFLQAIINDLMVSWTIAKLQSPSEDGHAQELKAIVSFVKSKTNPDMQNKFIDFLLKLIKTDNAPKDSDDTRKEIPPLITDQSTQKAVFQALVELAPQGKQAEEAVFYLFNTLGSNTDAFKKALTLIIDNDKHQTKSTVVMPLNEITVDDGNTLEKLEFWINLSQKFNELQSKELNQIIINKYVAKIGGPVVIPALIGVLKDQNEYVRNAAAEALGKTGSPAAIPALIEALKDAYLYRAAAKALARIEEAYPGSTTSKQKDSSNSETLKAGSAETTQKENDREQ